MSTSTIRSALVAINEYYKTPETKSRAEGLVNNLTSDERETILKLIKESNTPILEPRILSKKLQEIHNQDNNQNFLALTSKDADLSPCHLILMNIWRAVKDILGFRISDKKLLKKLDAYSLRAESLSNARADIPELLFSTAENLEAFMEIAKNTDNFDKEIIPADEYQTLGMLYLGSSFTLDEIESAYRSTLKKHAKDAVRLNEAKKAFQTVYALGLVKLEFIEDQSQPLTLKVASENYRSFSESQKKKLTFLVKIYIAYSLFQVDQDDQ